MNHYLKTLLKAIKKELESGDSEEILQAVGNQELIKENIDLKLRIAALEKENTLLSLVGSTHLPYLPKEANPHAIT